jgi:molybdopterin molybdotransferase
MNAPATPARKPLMPVREALDFLLAAARPVDGIEQVPTLEANGRVLAEDQASTLDVPSESRLAMSAASSNPARRRASLPAP